MTRPTARVVDRFVTASSALIGIAVRSIESAIPPVTVPQHRVLVLLASEGDLTIGELAELLGINQSNASRLLDRLQKLDLVTRERALEDGRLVRTRLTRLGHEVVESVMGLRRTEVAAVLAKLTPEQAAGAAMAMEAFNRAAHESDASAWLP